MGQYSIICFYGFNFEQNLFQALHVAAFYGEEDIVRELMRWAKTKDMNDDHNADDDDVDDSISFQACAPLCQVWDAFRCRR